VAVPVSAAGNLLAQGFATPQSAAATSGVAAAASLLLCGLLLLLLQRRQRKKDKVEAKESERQNAGAGKAGDDDAAAPSFVFSPIGAGGTSSAFSGRGSGRGSGGDGGGLWLGAAGGGLATLGGSSARLEEGRTSPRQGGRRNQRPSSGARLQQQQPRFSPSLLAAGYPGSGGVARGAGSQQWAAQREFGEDAWGGGGGGGGGYFAGSSGLAPLRAAPAARSPPPSLPGQGAGDAWGGGGAGEFGMRNPLAARGRAAWEGGW
jgi:hypothetical protein